MAKRNRIESALKKAQSLLSTYIPGRKRAEATLDEVLRVLGQARGVLTARRRRRATGSGGRAKARKSQRKTTRRKSGRTGAAGKRSARRSRR